MSEQKPPFWLVVVSILMLFVSGAWTLGALMPILSKDARLLVLTTVTTANVSFLIAVLAAMLIYEEFQSKSLRMILVVAFSVGILALIISVIIFSVSFVVAPPKYYPD